MQHNESTQTKKNHCHREQGLITRGVVFQMYKKGLHVCWKASHSSIIDIFAKQQTNRLRHRTMSSSANTRQDRLKPTLGGKQPNLCVPGTEAFDQSLCYGVPCAVSINNDAVISSDKSQRLKFGLTNPLEEKDPGIFSLLIVHENYGVVATSLDVLGFQVHHPILSWDVCSLVADFAGNRISDLSNAAIQLRELFGQEPRWAERGMRLTFTISNATAVRIWRFTSQKAEEMRDDCVPSVNSQSQAVIDTVEDPNAAYKLRVWFVLPEEKVDEYNSEWITKLHQFMKRRTPLQSISREDTFGKDKVMKPSKDKSNQ